MKAAWCACLVLILVALPSPGGVFAQDSEPVEGYSTLLDSPLDALRQEAGSQEPAEPNLNNLLSLLAGNGLDGAKTDARAVSLNSLKSTKWYVEIDGGSTLLLDRIYFASYSNWDWGYQGVSFYPVSGVRGDCFLGSDLDANYDYNCIIAYSGGSIAAEVMKWDMVNDNVSGIYYLVDKYGYASKSYPLIGSRRGCSSSCACPECPVCPETPVEDGVYYVPFVPRIADMSVGFAFTNYENSGATTITIDYYSNDGQAMGRQTVQLPGKGQTSAMATIEPGVNGWAKVTATNPIKGLALVFGYGDNPMFDMDLVTEGKTELLVTHVATTYGWGSKAMLANPNNSPAQVTATLQTNAGATGASQSFTIPAMGAAQYDLAALGGQGTAKITSSQPLVGFELYDALGAGTKFQGGLTMPGVGE